MIFSKAGTDKVALAVANDGHGNDTNTEGRNCDAEMAHWDSLVRTAGCSILLEGATY